MINFEQEHSPHQGEWFVGLMSGTSLDGVDIAAVQFIESKITSVITDYAPYPTQQREQLAHLAKSEQFDPIVYGTLDRQLGEFFGKSLLKSFSQHKFLNQVSLEDIVAIGSHGQTIRHHPKGQYSFTWQMGDPNSVCELTKRPVCFDFRRRDIAAGGQGAPLAPLFHEFLYPSHTKNTVIINLGGIANITVLGSQRLACDTGPANTLLNQWCYKHTGALFDKNGAWGQTGTLNQELLEALLQHSYLARSIPKSTGPEEFHLQWVESILADLSTNKTPNPEDIQATLHHFTAQTIALHVKRYVETADIVVAGGGAHNQFLMQLISQLLEPIGPVQTSKKLDPDAMEAVAFAWLAREHYYKRVLNTSSFTGAKTPVILGTMAYP